MPTNDAFDGDAQLGYATGVVQGLLLCKGQFAAVRFVPDPRVVGIEVKLPGCDRWFRVRVEAIEPAEGETT